ncbi:MAG: hypothetical protein LBV59_21385 [Sphingobacterium sp.]|jgi:hypothetical protein|uniref:hypothetical protein n=1 Tax=Sphingobacterium sp. TaxID=341027 RepID=UPI0028442592|nr:hypothetical protein [Sphingobacterium sp.]MDR3010498.1 hypothetical protein [Sphingobacterium sp.]
MIYLSAQPDTTYFIWQLEIQIRNFLSLGIKRDHIQIVVGYNNITGLSPQFVLFIEQNHGYAQFFSYPDYRKETNYISSIRPHILKQHFQKFPELEEMTIFYHDSDILFSRIPNIPAGEKNNICYVSDTRNYLDSQYIRGAATDGLLNDMINIVGISKEILERNDSHTGGAQYVLKGITTSFWEKVEKDCEELYALMKRYNHQLWEDQYPKNKEFKNKKRGIQAWCADMWAVLWNLWFFEKRVQIHPEMDFSWPFSPIDEWDKKSIQHYSGNITEKDKFFKKTEYLNYPPWYDDGLLTIPPTTCSFKIVEFIRNRRQELDAERKSIFEKAIIFRIEKIDQSIIRLFELLKKYIQKYLNVAVFLNGEEKREMDEEIDSSPYLWNDRYWEEYDQCLILPIHVLPDIASIIRILEESNHTSLWFDVVTNYRVDALFVESFEKLLDSDLLYQNRGKFNRKECSRGCYALLLHRNEKRADSNLVPTEDNFPQGRRRILPIAYNLLLN